MNPKALEGLYSVGFKAFHHYRLQRQVGQAMVKGRTLAF